MPQFLKEHAENIPETDVRRRTFILDTTQNHGKFYLLDNVRRCNIAYSVVHVQLFFKSILFIIVLLFSRPD